MPISRERLQARLVELKPQAEQLKQQYLALTGAIADIEYWIQELDTSPDPTSTDSVPRI